MSHGYATDTSSALESIHHGLYRRRRRPFIEGQSPRCPLCNRLMVLLMLRRGPGFRCGCAVKSGQEKSVP
jgi:hypothetical protein